MLVGVFVVFLLLVAFVVVLVVTIGMHNHGIKKPPGPKPSETRADLHTLTHLMRPTGSEAGWADGC